MPSAESNEGHSQCPSRQCSTAPLLLCSFAGLLDACCFCGGCVTTSLAKIVSTLFCSIERASFHHVDSRYVRTRSAWQLRRLCFHLFPFFSSFCFSEPLPAFASAVFPHDIETVWAVVRDFTAVPKRFASVETVTLDGPSAFSVGAHRTIKWKSGEEVTQRLLEVSDLHYHIAYETTASNVPGDASAAITTIRLYRISETKQTLVSWSTEFAADVAQKVVALEQKNYLQNLVDLRNSF